MAREQYDYSHNPQIQDFVAEIRINGDAYINPVLHRKEKAAAQTLSEISHIEISGIDPFLLPHKADQGLLLTPFDEFDGMYVDIPPEEFQVAWKRSWEAYRQLAIHPSRITAMRELEAQGFKKPESNTHIGVLDEAFEEGKILQLSDLGQNTDLVKDAKSEAREDYIAQLITKRKTDSLTSQEEEEIKVFVNEVSSKKQTHRTALLATGPFSFVGRRVRSFVGLGAMPDINGSVLALQTAAEMFMLAEVPEVGVFSDPERQAALAKAVLERLTEDNPLLKRRSKEDKEFIVDHWRSSVVGVLEVNEYKALKRAEKLAEVGVTSFRPYGHTSGGDIVVTTRSLRKEHANCELFPSQITNAETAIACEANGGDAIVIGVGSGGQCTTADLSQFIPSNALLASKLRGKLGIPIIGEGGALDEPIISILVGMSGVNGSGSIGGGTFESPGGVFYLTRDGQTFLKPYGGEASPRTKWQSKRLYATGYPYFAEGDQGFKQLHPLEVSMTQKVIRHYERIVLGAVVAGVDLGPFIIQEMQNLDPKVLFVKSPTTQYLQRTH